MENQILDLPRHKWAPYMMFPGFLISVRTLIVAYRKRDGVEEANFINLLYKVLLLGKKSVVQKESF